ncbi:MAG: hypothetical protein RLZZ436_3923 [Planctomycetota bacterium]|jgi:uncharacterized protein with von Willebrand factor type A (vWA) domain
MLILFFRHNGTLQMDNPASPPRHIGGIIHTYQQYDPASIPPPAAESPDLISPVFEHLLEWGSLRELSEEELARAIRLDPGQFAGLGPSLDTLIRMLQERRQKILSTWETDSVRKKADRRVADAARDARPPGQFSKPFWNALKSQQLYALENLWYRAERTAPEFAARLTGLIDVLGRKYLVDMLAASYEFTGRKSMSPEEAVEIYAELKKIDELLKQLEEARKNAQLAVIDLEELSQFADPQAVEDLRKFQEQIADHLRQLLEREGLGDGKGALQLTPKAYRLFQSRLLSRIFSDLAASRSGRHQQAVIGEGVVELQQTRPWEFGDPVSQLDIPATLINTMLRQGPSRPLRMQPRDMEVHRTRNNPRCATVVLMDMSGSMRYDGQYMNVKRMALALNGLITSEFPGDFLRFIELHTFAKPVQPGELVSLMPKMPTITSPVVRLRADMSREDVTEMHIPPHFTNIQHGLQMARQFLTLQDSPNRQVVLITDGLPTAHFEGSLLYMLYPPDPRTEEATLREGRLCSRDGITINLFLLPSWSQSREDVQFAHRLAESTGGRVFFTAGRDLDRCVVWDYVSHRREILGG